MTDDQTKPFITREMLQRCLEPPDPTLLVGDYSVVESEGVAIKFQRLRDGGIYIHDVQRVPSK